MRTTLHRNASLLAVSFLSVHVLTAIADRDASVSLVAAVVPLESRLWVGLGALALDLVALLVLTSLLRRRLPHRIWRAIHWSADAAWPVAVAHGVGMGTDNRTWWLRCVTILCLAVVGAGVVWRLYEPATS